MEENVWYLGERAEQLAIVYLSRRNDLVVLRNTGPYYGWDLLVSLTKGGEYTGRMFGVAVKALRSHQQVHGISTGSEEVRIAINKHSVPEDIPFPLCIFAFIMENDEGYYKWVKKPVYGPDNKSQLILNPTSIFKKLDATAIDNIVQEVNQWYENKVRIPA
jgi:hypothetical protein